jgi:AcrR family transcriptional regulator
VTVEPGLRERKKQRTRAAIVRTALALFAERGFDGTTVAEIADAADISPRTFFGYFPSKEDVVFADDELLIAAFTVRIRDRAPDEDAFDALRAWVVESEELLDFESPAERARRRLIRETPALHTRERAAYARLEEVLVDAVAADLGVDRDSLRPHLVSAAAIAGLDAIGRLHDAAPADRPARTAAEVMDEALVFLQGGLEALRRLPRESQTKEH